MSIRECKVLSQGNKFLTLNKVNGSCELRYEIIHVLSLETALTPLKKLTFISKCITVNMIFACSNQEKDEFIFFLCKSIACHRYGP